MRCNPSRWLWGLIPVAMLSWGTYYRERPNVEADLTVRATEALGAAGQPWAKVTMTGREAVITGRAQKDGDPKAALDIVRGVWGIRTVQLKTDLAGQAAPPERIGPQPDEAAIAAAKAEQEAEAAAALKAKEEAEAAARKAEEEAAAKARAEAEAAAALKAKEEAEAAAALKAREEAEAAAAQRAKEQTEAAMKAQAEAEAALKAEEDAVARKAQEEADAAAAAQKAKEDAEAAALKAKEEVEAAARKAEEEAAAAKAKEEAEAAAREAEALAAQKAKQEADMAAEAKADAEAAAKKAAEEEAKRAARKTTAETEACEKKLSEAVTEDVILFDRASAEIDRKSARTIKRLSEIIKTCPGARVEVEGHTDSEGTDERNQNLSERRARAVVDSLVKAGVAEDRLSAVGFGAGRPAVSNDTKAGMAKNRRIEFKVFTD